MEQAFLSSFHGISHGNRFHFECTPNGLDQTKYEQHRSVMKLTITVSKNISQQLKFVFISIRSAATSFP